MNLLQCQPLPNPLSLIRKFHTGFSVVGFNSSCNVQYGKIISFGAHLIHQGLRSLCISLSCYLIICNVNHAGGIMQNLFAAHPQQEDKVGAPNAAINNNNYEPR